MKSAHQPSLLTLATLAALGALLAAPAIAQDDSYFYGGAGLGQARTRVDNGRMARNLLGAGPAISANDKDDHATAYKLFGGYQLNRYVGIEAGYFNLGTFGFGATTTPAGSISGDFRVQGANLDAVGTLPFTERLSGLARVGVQYARSRLSTNSTGAATVASPQRTDREANAKIGVGLQYAFSPSFMMRGEVERYRVNDTTGGHPQVSLYSVSLVFPFGRSEAPMRRAMAEPAYVASAPQPVRAVAPQVVEMAAVVAPPPPVVVVPQVRRVSYAAESFFAFDKAELRPAGKAALDTFVIELRGTRFDSITVQGHADRIGTTAYNQTLSLERAEAVKSYLVNSARLDPAKIIATGKSELEPVTPPEQCKGATSAPVIACLQPDRRVEIEVTGTR